MEDIREIIGLVSNIISDKPLVVVLIVAIGAWAIVFLKTGKNPLGHNNNHADRGKEADERLQKALDDHNESNERDFQNIKDEIGAFREEVGSDFRSLNQRIDNLIAGLVNKK